MRTRSYRITASTATAVKKYKNDLQKKKVNLLAVVKQKPLKKTTDNTQSKTKTKPKPVSSASSKATGTTGLKKRASLKTVSSKSVNTLREKKISKPKAQARILTILERIVKIDKKGKSEYIQVNEAFLKKKGCTKLETVLFQSNNGVPYLRRDSPICRKYLVERVYDQTRRCLHGFRLIGFNQNVYFARSIPQGIRQQVLQKYECKCAWCGSKDRLEVDHKNGRYNSVMNKIDDFQLLCKSCNDKKRERCKKCTESNKRFDAKDVSKHLYKCSYLQGNCKYNEKTGCKGCFLYDIEEFNKNHDKCNTEATVVKRKAHEIELVVKEVVPRSKTAAGCRGRVVMRQKISL